MKVNRPPSPAFRAALASAHRTRLLPVGNPGRTPQPQCAGRPGEYVDYDVPPPADERKALCDGCPLFDLCAKSAAYSRPSWGIHAGVAWEDGRRFKDYPDTT